MIRFSFERTSNFKFRSISQKFIALALMVCFATLTGCGVRTNNRDGIDSRPEVKAKPKVGDSFDVHTNPQAGTGPLEVDHQRISITRSALEKEFLLQVSLISQPVAAMGNGLRSRIVAFRMRDEKLYLIEATQGHVVTTDLPSNLVLAEFPVIESDKNKITFDFNAGMSTLFLADDWVTEEDSAEYDANSNFTSISARVSYIESATLNSSNQLVIRQIAQLVSAGTNGDVNQPVEVKYYISPYAPDLSYKPMRSQHDLDHIGFFEAAPILTDAGSVNYLARFNPQKPVTFAVSANTPAEFKQAVRDGVLYWNKALGREITKVIDAPAGVTAPDLDYNVIQWVPYNDAGFSYADAQMDPRTGEVLHAQVFFTSAFSFGGRAEARALLRHLRSSKAIAANKRNLKRISLRGFINQPMCQFSLNEKMLDSVASLLSSGADDADVLRAAQDYVRETSAHEVGHTLGLRHNFAGSLATNFSLNDRNKNLKAYFADGKAPAGIVTSSSVMDYEQFEESLFTGDQIAKLPTALIYDQKAISVLYDQTPLVPANMPLFCTDSHIGKYADCNQFDTGASVVDYASWSVNDNLASVPGNLIERFIRAKVPPAGEAALEMSRVALPDPEKSAPAILGARKALFAQLTDAASLLKVKRLFPIIGPFNSDEVRSAHLNYLTGQIQSAGGLTTVFSPIPADYATKASAAFAKLLATTHGAGIGRGETPFEFSADEKAVMQTNADLYFKKLEAALIMEELKILAGPAEPPAKLLDAPINDNLAELFATRVQSYVLAKTGDTVVGDIELPVLNPAPGEAKSKVTTVKLPVFAYAFPIRAAAAHLFGDARGEAPEWGLAQKSSVHDQLTDLTETPLGGVPLKKVSPEAMPKPIARWIIENLKMGALLE